MKKKLLVFAFLSLFSTIALSQEATISGAVGFTKPVSEKVQTKQPKQTKKSAREIGKVPQTDAAELLAKKTKNLSVMDNPRFAKKTYSRLKGRQEAIEQLQQKKLEEGSYPNEKAKEEALKGLEDKALVRFNDYQEEQEEVKNKINEDPRKGILDMASRVSQSEKIDEESVERSRAAQQKLNQKFQEEKGIAPDEYMNAYMEQVKAEAQQNEEEKQKAEQFPILNTEKDVKVEKIDEQNALLHVSVGAPRSKKE